MKLCPECNSDNIERTSSIGLRALACIVLIFIPFGIFIAWVPFVIPHSYECLVCGKEGKEDQLVKMDWRERELLTEQHRILEDKLNPLLNMWFLDQWNNLYKVIKGKGQLLLLKVSEDEIKPLRIITLIDNTVPYKLEVKDNLSSAFIVAGTKIKGVYAIYDAGLEKVEDVPERVFSAFGKTVFSEEEFHRLENHNIEQIKLWLIEKNKMVEPIELQII